MGKLSRRNMLKAGGALGALGALASPHRPSSTVDMVARRARCRAPERRRPAVGVGRRGRPAGRLTDRPRRSARVNELLRTWTKNGQPLPAGLPADLRDFMEYARQLPPWTDQGKLDTAVEFNKKRGLYLGVLYGFASGMMSTVIPKEARAVYYSKGGADMKDRIYQDRQARVRHRSRECLSSPTAK